ncbi:MAG: type II secretion system major pseudopilin GspG [Candidatus Didemnitutus sp.]|nr:type II secretion system major pseudopilin GspG [Candidatus Didemnitutus sp.]
MNSRSAFTLLEILVTLAIIGLLAGLAISNSDKIFGQSQEAVARIFVRDSLKTSLTRYRIDLGDYPSTAEGLAALFTAPANRAERWRGPYAEATGGKLPSDPWGEAYRYRYPGVKNKGGYDLYSTGPDKADGTEDDIGNW